MSSTSWVAPFWFYISMIKDGEIARMQNDYCTEHFDMTGWFLVISLARNKQTNKKNTLCRFEKKQEEYILIFFSRSIFAEGEHSPEQKGKRG